MADYCNFWAAEDQNTNRPTEENDTHKSWFRCGGLNDALETKVPRVGVWTVSYGRPFEPPSDLYCLMEIKDTLNFSMHFSQTTQNKYLSSHLSADIVRSITEQKKKKVKFKLRKTLQLLAEEVSTPFVIICHRQLSKTERTLVLLNLTNIVVASISQYLTPKIESDVFWNHPFNLQ